MKKDSEEFQEVCMMLNAAKKKFSEMTPEELEKWDEENENSPVAAGDLLEKNN